MKCFRTALTAITFVLLGLAAPSAFAADGSAPRDILPGVDTKAGADVVGVDPVRTDAAPELMSQPGAGWLRVGDWDVKISGKVTYDISTRPLSPDSR